MRRLKYHAALLVANLFFGINYSYYTSLIGVQISSDALYFLRTVAIFLCYTPLMFILGRGRVELRDLWKFALVTLLLVIGRMYFMLVGMNYTSPIDGSIIATTGPVVMVLIALARAKERVTMWRIAGIALGLSGALTLIFINPHMGSSYDNKLLGNSLLFISIICSSVDTIYVKSLFSKYHPITILGWAYAFGMLFVLPVFTKDFLQIDFASWSLATWGEVSYVVVIGTLVATALNYYGLKGVSATSATVYVYTQPFIATAFALFRGQDNLTILTAICCLQILVGLYFMDKNDRRLEFWHNNEPKTT